MFDVRLIVCKCDCDNVKPASAPGNVLLIDITFSRPPEGGLLQFCDRFFRCAEGLRSTAFDFNEHQLTVVLGNEIDFPVFKTESSGEKDMSQIDKVLFRQAFTKIANRFLRCFVL